MDSNSYISDDTDNNHNHNNKMKKRKASTLEATSTPGVSISGNSDNLVIFDNNNINENQDNNTNKNDNDISEKSMKKREKRKRQRQNKKQRKLLASLTPDLPTVTVPLPVPKNWRESVRCFVASVFALEDFIPYKNFLGTDDVNLNVGAIINNPQITMANEFLGCRVEEVVKNVMIAAHITPDPRTKPVLAVLRGMGGGKTRMLSELRNNLMVLHKDTVTIAITFNNNTPINGNELRLKYSADVNFAIAVMARMITAVFNLDLFTVLSRINKSLTHLPESVEVDAISILRDCVSTLVKIIRQHRGGHPPVNRLVVIVDEMSEMERLLTSLKKTQGNELDEDVTSCIRRALLDNIPEGIENQKEFDFEVALVLSTLTVSTLGVTHSHRAIEPIVLPAELSVEEILTKWWRIDANTSYMDRERFALLAACLCNLPRLVESAATFIANKRTQNQFHVDRDFMKEIIVYLRKSLTSRYLISSFPTEQLLYNIIYNIPTKISKPVLGCIKQSVLTNSLERFTEEFSILPTINIFVIGVVNNADIPSHSKIMKEAFTKIENFLYHTKNGGFILEEYFFLWLKVRFQVAVLIPDSINLKTIFGLTDIMLSKTVSTELVRLLNKPFPIFYYDNATALQEVEKPFEKVGRLFEKNLKNSSYINKDAFLANIASMGNCECRRSCEGDAFDGIFKFIYDANKEPLYIFWDNKSPHMEGAFVDKIPQYKHIKNIMAEKTILYLYCTATSGTSKFTSADCAILKNDVTVRFFGPIWNIYRASRISMKS